MANSLKGQARLMSGSAGIKPLTVLTDDELAMQETGKSHVIRNYYQLCNLLVPH